MSRVNSNDVKQRSEPSQRFHFNSSEVKQRSESIHRFHFNSSEAKQRVVRDIILRVEK